MMNNKSILLSADTLSIDETYKFVLDVTCGGNVLFVGTVRNKNKGKTVTHLDFESYAPMAIKEMEKIADQCFEKFDVKKIAIHHRTGHVGLTDIAVIIAVSSPHRSDAFTACKYCIDSLKETVPIWKKEYLEDGSYWVGARP